MTELNLSLKSGAPSTAASVSKTRRGMGRIILAVILSFIIPGLGHVYVRKPLRGLLFAVATTFCSFLTFVFHLHFAFRGLVACFVMRILLALLTAIDAGYFASAKRWVNSREYPPAKWRMISAFILVVMLGVYPIPDILLKYAIKDFGAFKIPSASMCPTICEGDRIVANRTAYANSTPNRGDIIMMKHPSSEALFIKRVVGIEGDVVTQTNGRILVNGQPLGAPSYHPGCGATDTPYSNAGALGSFDAVKVPSSSLFVIGDNLPNSFDSRLPEFGRVDVSQVRGRPLFIYWSWTPSRIGCELR